MTKWVLALLLPRHGFRRTLGVDFSSPGSQNGSSVWNLEYTFAANTSAKLIALAGAFDHNQDGFAQDQQVGLWTSAGVLTGFHLRQRQRSAHWLLALQQHCSSHSDGWPDLRGRIPGR